VTRCLRMANMKKTTLEAIAKAEAALDDAQCASAPSSRRSSSVVGTDTEGFAVAFGATLFFTTGSAETATSGIGSGAGAATGTAAARGGRSLHESTMPAKITYATNAIATAPRQPMREPECWSAGSHRCPHDMHPRSTALRPAAPARMPIGPTRAHPTADLRSFMPRSPAMTWVDPHSGQRGALGMGATDGTALRPAPTSCASVQVST
jgi:hypothetical protein